MNILQSTEGFYWETKTVSSISLGRGYFSTERHAGLDFRNYGYEFQKDNQWDFLVGMTADDSREHLSKSGYTMRVLSFNGNENCISLYPKELDRLNVRMVNDLVSEVVGFG